MKKNMKWFVAVAVILIIVMAVVGSKKEKGGIPVIAEKVTRRSIVEVIPANGKIKPVVEVKISPDVSGEIIELNFKEGDYVKKGDLIIKIKQDVYISMKERAEASLNSVKAQLTQTEAQFVQIEQTFQRNKRLYEQGAISEAEYENSLTQYMAGKEQIKAAGFNVKSANAALKEANENLVKTVIYAPMEGIISKLSVEKGERVVGTSQMAGTEMLRIANFNEMEVLVDVNENDIIRIERGDTAIIDVDAYPGHKFTGIVTQIANSAKNIGMSMDQVTNFEVRIVLDPSSYKELAAEGKNPFRPGMSASASIQTTRVDSAIAIPLQSITTRSDIIPDSVRSKMGINESLEQVFVINNDNKVEIRTVTTGIQDLTKIQVITGVEEEEMIVTGPFTAISKQLKKDAKVKIVTEDKLIKPAKKI